MCLKGSQAGRGVGGPTHPGTVLEVCMCVWSRVPWGRMARGGDRPRLSASPHRRQGWALPCEAITITLVFAPRTTWASLAKALKEPEGPGLAPLSGLRAKP